MRINYPKGKPEPRQLSSTGRRHQSIRVAPYINLLEVLFFQLMQQYASFVLHSPDR